MNVLIIQKYIFYVHQKCIQAPLQYVTDNALQLSQQPSK